MRLNFAMALALLVSVAVVAATAPLRAADLSADLDKLRSLRAEAYQKARDAFLADPAAREFLAQRLADPEHSGDWLAYALQTRLNNPTSGKAADGWSPPDKFDAKKTGFAADILNPKALAELNLKIGIPLDFNGRPVLIGADTPPRLALMLERLVQNTAHNSDGFRFWELTATLSYTILNQVDQRALVGNQAENPREKIPTVAGDPTLARAWVLALQTSGQEPLVQLVAAARASGDREPDADSDQRLQRFAEEKTPLGALAALLYAGRQGHQHFTLDRCHGHGVWLETWAKTIQPAHAAFLLAFFTTPPTTDRNVDNHAHLLDYGSYRFDEIFQVTLWAPSVLLGSNEKALDPQFRAATQKQFVTTLIDGLTQMDRMPGPMAPGALEYMHQYFPLVGVHLDGETVKALTALPLLTPAIVELRQRLLDAAQKFKTPFFSGKEVDALIALEKANSAAE